MFGVTVASGVVTALAIQLATRRLEDHTITVVRSELQKLMVMTAAQPQTVGPPTMVPPPPPPNYPPVNIFLYFLLLFWAPVVVVVAVAIETPLFDILSEGYEPAVTPLEPKINVVCSRVEPDLGALLAIKPFLSPLCCRYLRMVF